LELYVLTGLDDHVLQFAVAKLIMLHASDHTVDFLVFVRLRIFKMKFVSNRSC